MYNAGTNSSAELCSNKELLCVNIWNDSFFTTLWAETDIEKKINMPVSAKELLSFLRNVKSGVIEFDLYQNKIVMENMDNIVTLNQIDGSSKNQWLHFSPEKAHKIYVNSCELIETYKILVHGSRNETKYYIDIDKHRILLTSVTPLSISSCEVHWACKINKDVQVEVPSKIMSILHAYYLKKENNIIEFLIGSKKDIIMIELDAGVLMSKITANKNYAAKNLSKIEYNGFLHVSSAILLESLKKLIAGKKKNSKVYLGIKNDTMSVCTIKNTPVDTKDTEDVVVCKPIIEEAITIPVVPSSVPHTDIIVDGKLLIQAIQTMSEEDIKINFVTTTNFVQAISITDSSIGAIHTISYSVFNWE